MEKIRDYLTKEGWKRDWSKTKKDLVKFNILPEFKKGTLVYSGKTSKSPGITSFVIAPARILGWNPVTRVYTLELNLFDIGRKDIIKTTRRGILD